MCTMNCGIPAVHAQGCRAGEQHVWHAVMAKRGNSVSQRTEWLAKLDDSLLCRVLQLGNPHVGGLALANKHAALLVRALLR
jgi:hypothetical protein